MNQLVTWLYVSRSLLSPYEAAAAVAGIVQVSRARNAELNVTGALAFTGSAFGQFLEGPAGSVAALRASIMRDGRHEDILTVGEEPVGQRVFADWSLAYSGGSSFFGRVLERVREDHARHPSQSARDLTRLLRELVG